MIFDHLHRRSSNSEGLKVYPNSILECHETFTRQNLETLEAKVIIIYGSKLQQRILGNANLLSTVLPLWGWLKDVSLLLDHEVNYKNADPRFKLGRVLLFAVHPQRLFYEPRNSATTARQDQITPAAAQIVSGEINCVEGYYTNKIW